MKTHFIFTTLFFLFFLSLPFSVRAEDVHYEMGIGFPHLTNLAFKKNIDKNKEVGMNFAYLPVNLLVDDVNHLSSSRWSDYYNLVVNPHVDIFSTGFFLNYYPWKDSQFFSLQFNILVVNLGGTIAIENVTSHVMTNFAEVNATFFQPHLDLLYGGSLYQSPSFDIKGSFGLAYFAPPSIQIHVQGSLPSFLDAAPEYRQSIRGALDDVEGDLYRVISQLKDRPPVLPVFYLSLSW